jgi:hypothetical protein
VNRSRVNVWRDALRNSDLDPTAKLAAFVISTYMNASGVSWPSKELIAQGCGARSVRTADHAIHRLEAAGYLRVSRSHGRSSNRYYVAVPTPHPDSGLVTSNPASDDSQPGNSGPPTPHPAAGGSLKGLKARDARSPKVRAASLIEEMCVRCGERFTTTDGDEVYCSSCVAVEVAA